MTHQDEIKAWVGGGAAKAGTGMPNFAQGNSPQQIAQIAQVIASLYTNSVQPLGGN